VHLLVKKTFWRYQNARYNDKNYRLSYTMTRLKAHPNKIKYFFVSLQLLLEHIKHKLRTSTPYCNCNKQTVRCSKMALRVMRSWKQLIWWRIPTPGARAISKGLRPAGNPLTSGFYSGAEDSVPLGCDAVWLEEELPTFSNAFIFRVQEFIPK
jgi:hypothetical protein